jgi:hypothetical protein
VAPGSSIAIARALFERRPEVLVAETNEKLFPELPVGGAKLLLAARECFPPVGRLIRELVLNLFAFAIK